MDFSSLFFTEGYEKGQLKSQYRICGFSWDYKMIRWEPSFGKKNWGPFKIRCLLATLLRHITLRLGWQQLLILAFGIWFIFVARSTLTPRVFLSNTYIYLHWFVWTIIRWLFFWRGRMDIDKQVILILWFLREKALKFQPL